MDRTKGHIVQRELTVLEGPPAACCTPLAATAMSDDEAETTARLFKALADPGRVRIVNLLANADAPVCVCDLTPQLDLSQPTVSFHLKKLVQAGLIEREQRGVWAFYSIDREALGRLSTVFELEGATT
jgi:ArsR family transcriptional regulator